jgi:hypothetical protein
VCERNIFLKVRTFFLSKFSSLKQSVLMAFAANAVTTEQQSGGIKSKRNVNDDLSLCTCLHVTLNKGALQAGRTMRGRAILLNSSSRIPHYSPAIQRQARDPVPAQGTRCSSATSA